VAEQHLSPGRLTAVQPLSTGCPQQERSGRVFGIVVAGAFAGSAPLRSIVTSTTREGCQILQPRRPPDITRSVTQLESKSELANKAPHKATNPNQMV
jgi:hypothetical protein